jgi:beta-mannosidase
LFLGWHRGSTQDLSRLAARFPRLVQFVGGFGAQAVPESDEFIDHTSWPDLDWDVLSDRHGMDLPLFNQRVPPSQFASYQEWRTATQIYQAEVIKTHIETLRTLKYRPTGGFCVYVLNDAMPMISCSLLDHKRVPKLAYTALAEACRPVIVVAERLPAVVHPGQTHQLNIHVVSDLRDELTQATVSALVTIGDSVQQWRWSGNIAADDCTRVGQIDIVIGNDHLKHNDSDHSESVITIDLTLECGDVVATNRYTTALTN